MNRRRVDGPLSAHGFTLIELLVVIAIIAILAGIAVVGAPRVLEKARITKVETDFANIRTALSAYYADNGSFPPGYGFPKWGWMKMELQNGGVPSVPANIDDMENAFYLRPFMAYINLYGKTDLYDRFSSTYDTDGNRTIGLMEYQPIGKVDPATKNVSFDPEFLYDQPLSLDDIKRTKSQDYGKTRPFVYVPVNLDQFRPIRTWWNNNDKNANSWPSNWRSMPQLQPLKNPAPRHDAYVLISVGPNENTGGVVGPPDEEGFLAAIGNPAYYYPFLALRAYYLATRDANDGGKGNGLPDFDWRARVRQGEGKQMAYPGEPELALLPDGSPGAGPMIYNPGQ